MEKAYIQLEIILIRVKKYDDKVVKASMAKPKRSRLGFLLSKKRH
ncbi:hypothetical protein RU97_GL002314 [Enterococcus canis]|uniref:Uncharacterized protein n=1 Tax=Enterococcus canis TaxID=214095 RepID=A0A1L8REM5_9ENTE|nr:hypothetical protein RU97_GL002314 [Enterococcus canis]